MQQDRSTGWRLGSNRTTQFRYQVAGIAMGAVMAVVFAKVFMNAYPVLRLDQTGPAATHVQGWQSAMTFKMVGALSNLTHPKSYTYTALWIGVGLGFGIEAIRKVLRAWPVYKAFVAREQGRLQRRLSRRHDLPAEPLRIFFRRIRGAGDVDVVRCAAASSVRCGTPLRRASHLRETAISPARRSPKT